MSATYTTSLRLWEGTPLAVSIKGAWGPPLNENFTLLESAITDSVGVNIAGLTTYILTTANGTADQARPLVQQYTGALTANCTVTLPNVPKFGYAVNLTTGGFNVILTAGAGTTATIPPDGNYYYFQADGATNVSLVPHGFGAVAATSATITGSLTAAGAAFSAPVSVGTPSNPQLTSLNGPIGLNGVVIASATMEITGQTVTPVANTGYYSQTSAYYNQTGNVSYSLLTSGSTVANAFYATSDARLKTDVQDISASQAYQWITDGRPVTYRKNGEWGAGFIAQDEMKSGRIRSVASMPDPAMLGSPKGYRLVKNYECEIAFLSAAIKGLIQRVNDLEARLALPDA